LKVAAAAPTEVRARRLDANGRRRQDFDNRGEGQTRAHRFDADAHEVARRGQRDENGLPARVRQPNAAGQYALDRDLKLRPRAQRFASILNVAARRLSLALHKRRKS